MEFNNYESVEKKVNRFAAAKMDRPFTIDNVRYQAGDYLVIEEDGTVEGYTEAAFSYAAERTYCCSNDECDNTFTCGTQMFCDDCISNAKE